LYASFEDLYPQRSKKPRAEILSDFKSIVVGSGFGLRLRGIATESDDTHFTILVKRVVSPESECRRLRLRYALSEREAAVLMMLRKRMSDKEVAAQLSISLGTVRHHLRQLASKLAVAGQSEVRRFTQGPESRVGASGSRSPARPR